jgi:uncharacterized membrane protein YkgB
MIQIVDKLYSKFSRLMERYSVNVMRIALAIVYLWFGALKVIGTSSAGELVEKTVYWFNP